MITVKKKPLTPNIIWDASSNCALCKFVNGVIKTNDEALVSRLKALGHTVEGQADAKPLDKMTIDEMKAYAAEHSIDLGEDRNKRDILKVIQEADIGE